MYTIRVSFKRVLNFRSFLFTCLLTLYSLISWALKSANFGPAADHIACCFLVPAWAIKGAAFLIYCWGKFSSTNYFGHNSCCNWAYFLSWVDFSGTGRCGKGNHARWLRVLVQRYTIKMSKTYLTHLYDSKHFICQPDDSNTLFYGIYGDSWNNITYALGEHHHRS